MVAKGSWLHTAILYFVPQLKTRSRDSGHEVIVKNHDERVDKQAQQATKDFINYLWLLGYKICEAVFLRFIRWLTDFKDFLLYEILPFEKPEEEQQAEQQRRTLHPHGE
mmetsp:Transcript_9371/g.34383  ORF Transcript_9371/g.34383 Transcript_9371/m.34383 type:complete len:109 (+) Transcript_9371:119-445(+)